MITQKFLKECVDYNPETGSFTHLLRPRHHFDSDKGYNIHKTKFDNKQCKLATFVGHKGYLYVSINNKELRSHRLAFLWMTGKMPTEQVDHINRLVDDNRWDNLREATAQQNQWNTKVMKTNTSGTTGVYWSAHKNRWFAKICIDGKQLHLGFFKCKEDAVLARKSKEVELRGKEFAKE